MSERIELLDDLGAEFARVAAEAEAGGRAHSRRRAFRSGTRARALAVAAGALVLLGGTAWAVPATRGAVDGVAHSLAGWVQGDDSDAPGRAVAPGDAAPTWFDERSGDTRVLAEADGVGLFVRRSDSDRGPWLEFGIGSGMVVADTLDGWRGRLAGRAVVVLPGPAAFGRRDLLDERGRYALLGVTTRDVERVELRYAVGPPLTGPNGDGGFVLLADAWRRPSALVAYDGAGRERERIDLSRHDMSYLCEREPGCPSAARRP